MTHRNPRLLWACLALLALVAPLLAITYGKLDGNGHPNTGAMLADFGSGQKEILCSGTLIAPRVFLTASHCTTYLESLGINDVWVTFDPHFTDSSTVFHGVMHSNPLYNRSQSDPQDIAVIVLDDAVNGILPASLPPSGLFDQLKRNGSLNGTKFTAVGYGDRQRQNGGGPPTYPFDNQRWVAISDFNALNNVWLRLSQNVHTGDGGTCYGDSGGPNFMGAGDSETSIIAAITITGDSACVATNVDYRLDTPQARAFLGQFVDLP